MRDVMQNKVLLSIGCKNTCILCEETDAQSRERLCPQAIFYHLPGLGLAMAIYAFLTSKRNNFTSVFLLKGKPQGCSECCVTVTNVMESIF